MPKKTKDSNGTKVNTDTVLSSSPLAKRIVNKIYNLNREVSRMAELPQTEKSLFILTTPDVKREILKSNILCLNEILLNLK